MPRKKPDKPTSKYIPVGGEHDTHLVERPTHVTNIDLWAQITNVSERLIDIRSDLVDVKTDIVQLKEHVNDRNEAIEGTLATMQKALDLKAEKTELVTSIGFRLLAKPVGRVMVGIVGAAVIATATEAHWVPWLIDAMRLFVKAVT